VKRFRAVVRGRVQGVGFRAATASEARRLQLTGWVRNQLDGTVEVDAEGEDAATEAFLAWLRRGPSYAHVTSVNSEWLPTTTMTTTTTTTTTGGGVSFEVR
jgi:acylphosphatase